MIERFLIRYDIDPGVMVRLAVSVGVTVLVAAVVLLLLAAVILGLVDLFSRIGAL